MPPSAGNPPDSQFGRLALQIGLVTAEQLQDAEALLADIRATGGPVPRLGEVMVEMGVLTPGQVEQVLARQDKTILACAACGARFNVAGLRPGARARCKRCGGILEVPAPPHSPKVSDTVRIDDDTVSEVRAAAAATAPPSFAPASGTVVPEVVADTTTGAGRLGKYVLECELGRGGMGVVYRARDEQLRRTVALKVLHNRRGRTPAGVRHCDRNLPPSDTFRHAP